MPNRLLLVGPAGAGKTHLFLDAFEERIKNEDPLSRDSCFVLPTQEHVERIILLLVQRKIPGFFHARVLTFSNWMESLFPAAEKPAAANVTKYLLLRQILQARPWPAFEEVQQGSGFLNVMLQFIGELKESLIPAEFFRERMNRMKNLEPDLAVKYESLAGIYEAYQQMLEARGLRDRQDEWMERIKNGFAECSGELPVRNVWFDGFFDFSPLQLAWLAAAARFPVNISISMTVDPDPRRRSLFSSVEHVVSRLTAAGFEVREAKRRKAASKALESVERGLFAPPGPAPLPSSPPEILVFEAVGMEGEMEMIARQIQHQIRQGGWRYSDFAVLLRQIGDYQSVIRSVFSRYRIPLEIHERERLSFAPMLHVIVRMLKIFREDWKRSDVLEFFRSSYVRTLGKEKKLPDWVDRLDLWARQKGISSGRSAWFEEGRKETAFSEEKNKGLKALADVEDSLRAAGSFEEIKRRLTEAVLTVFGIGALPEIDVSEETVPDAALGDMRRRDGRSAGRFLALLDEIHAGFEREKQGLAENPDAPAGFDAFADRFFRLVDLDLFSIRPRDKNRVQVYDVSLARQKQYRTVFAAGLLEKKFPVQIRENPVLSDWERRLFNGERTESCLAERLPRQAMERYLFYLTVTRAQEQLFLTYPKLDLEGKEQLPSYYVHEVSALFKGGLAKKKQFLARPFPHWQEAVTRRELEMSVMGDLWRSPRPEEKEQKMLAALTGELFADPAARARFERTAFRVEDRLTDERTAAFKAFQTDRLSATRIEEYAGCAFRYYAHRVLRLMDPEEDVNSRTRGTVLHETLEKCFALWFRDPRALPPDTDKAVRKALEELERQADKHPLLFEKKYQYDLDRVLLREWLERFLRFELERLPWKFEWGFGGTEDEYPPLTLNVEGRTLKLQGKIDRIDLDAGKKIAAVLDYKTKNEFQGKKLEMGLNLQLPIYVQAVRDLLKLDPAGAELYTIKTLNKKGFYRNVHAELYPEIGKQKLILTEEAFQHMMRRAFFYIEKFSDGIAQRKIEVRPRDCPDHYPCPYSAVCRVEKWRLPVISEEIRSEDRKELKLAGLDGVPEKAPKPEKKPKKAVKS